MKRKFSLIAGVGVTTRRVLAAATLIGVGSLLGWPAWAVDPVAGYDPTTDKPSNAYSFDFEGCDLSLDQKAGYTPAYDPPTSWMCRYDTSYPSGGNGDGYTDGNLGKAWNELDEVPHNIKTDSSGAAGPETYRIVVGGDNVIVLGDPSKGIGYDRITVFGLNSTFSDASCTFSIIGANQTGDFGLGGADLQVVQVVEMSQDADTVCVLEMTYRLAIGSSLISGSSNRGFVVAGTGDQSIPIPSDIQPQELSKTMTAVEDSEFKWTIAKTANPTTWDFGDTCDVATPTTKDVEVKITLTKGTATPTALTATSMVTATNPSSREVTYECTDVLYGIEPGDMTESILDTKMQTEDIDPNSAPTFDIVHDPIAAGTRSLRNELSCGIYVLDLIAMQLEKVNTLTAEFDLPDADILPGTVINNSVAVHDSENISGTGYDFKTGAPTGATGMFTGYTAGQWVPTDVAGPVIWDSNALSASAEIVFTKTVRVAPYTVDNGATLSDTASIPPGAATTYEASASTTFSSDPRVSLTIKKTIPDILQGSEEIDCNFTVKNDEGDDVVPGGGPLTLNFKAGDTYKEATLSNLLPDDYVVTEGTCGGLVATDPVSKIRNVDLTLAGATGYSACSADASFTNAIPAEDQARAQVDKKTFPAGFEDGWTMELKKCSSSDGSYTAPCNTVSTVVTADSTPDAYERFKDGGGIDDLLLTEGDYKVVETLKSGWKNVTSSGCMFNVDYPGSAGNVYSCQYINEKKGKVIIEKQTIPDGDVVTSFEYSQDVDASGNFFLKDDESKTFMDVVANNGMNPYYSVMELDPTPGYDLTNVVCTDDFDGNGYNINDSTEVKDMGDFTGAVQIRVDPGETVKCVYTNTKRGMVEVLKLTNGAQTAMPWSFTLVGPDVDTSDSVPPNPMDFGNAKLIAGETYRLCEVNIPVGWTAIWEIDVGSGYVMIPYDLMTANSPVGMDGYSNVFNPNYVPMMGNSNDTYCVNFVVDPDQTVKFRINNSYPGGAPRTIGYWKNWNTCSGGNQQYTAADNGGFAEGFWLLDDVLNNPGIKVSDYLILGADDCMEAVYLLDKRDLSNRHKKRASDPAYGLAAQLIAALANYTAGAETCPASSSAIADAQALLTSIEFDGVGAFLRPKDAEYSDANYLASQLDDYNNGILCSP